MAEINGALAAKIVNKMAEEFAAHREELITLDSAMGDGDLGIYMASGSEKAAQKIARLENPLPCDVLRKTGSTFAIEAPSTMGTLIATAFMTAGKFFAGKEVLIDEDIPAIYAQFAEGIAMRGHAKLGEKTILDALIPAADAAKAAIAAGKDGAEAAKDAYRAAKAGVETAKGQKAVYGRPAYFGDATIGKYDGGTIAGMLICKAISDVLGEQG